MSDQNTPTPTPGMLTDGAGKPSSMRMMSIISLLASIGFGAATLTVTTAGKEDSGFFITCAFLLGAFAPKALQKFIENNYTKAGK